MTEAVQFFIHYAFTELGLSRLWKRVFEFFEVCTNALGTKTKPHSFHRFNPIAAQFFT